MVAAYFRPRPPKKASAFRLILLRHPVGVTCGPYMGLLDRTVSRNFHTAL